MINTDIVNDFREYAQNPGKWYWRYIRQCSPKAFVYFFPRRDTLTDEEFEAMQKAAESGTLKIKIKSPD